MRRSHERVRTPSAPHKGNSGTKSKWTGCACCQQPIRHIIAGFTKYLESYSFQQCTKDCCMSDFCSRQGFVAQIVTVCITHVRRSGPGLLTARLSRGRH